MIRVRNRTKGTLLGERVDVAEKFFQRLRGLTATRDWGDRDGLWIEPCMGVHGFGMGYAVDVVLVDDAYIALALQTLAPWRVGRVHLEARAALELPAGTLARTGTEVGDALVLEELS